MGSDCMQGIAIRPFAHAGTPRTAAATAQWHDDRAFKLESREALDDKRTRRIASGKGAMCAVVTGPSAIPGSLEWGEILLGMEQEGSAEKMRESTKPQVSDKQSAPKLMTRLLERASPKKGIDSGEWGLLCEENEKPTAPEDISLRWEEVSAAQCAQYSVVWARQQLSA